MPRPLLALLLIIVLALTACGGEDSPDSPEPSTPASPGATEESSATEGTPDEIEVIRGWSEALTEGDIEAAAEFFALPSTAENGFTIDIETVEDAQVFNDSLPCGAELESTEEQGEFITATFRLTERPGVPACPGEGATAQTSFVIEDGKIVEWRRVAVPTEQGPAQTT